MAGEILFQAGLLFRPGFRPSQGECFLFVAMICEAKGVSEENARWLRYGCFLG